MTEHLHYHSHAMKYLFLFGFTLDATLLMAWINNTAVPYVYYGQNPAIKLFEFSGKCEFVIMCLCMFFCYCSLVIVSEIQSIQLHTHREPRT